MEVMDVKEIFGANGADGIAEIVGAAEIVPLFAGEDEIAVLD